MITKAQYEEAKNNITNLRAWTNMARHKIDEYLDEIIHEKESIDCYKKSIEYNREIIIRYEVEQGQKNGKL